MEWEGVERQRFYFDGYKSQEHVNTSALPQIHLPYTHRQFNFRQASSKSNCWSTWRNCCSIILQHQQVTSFILFLYLCISKLCLYNNINIIFAVAPVSFLFPIPSTIPISITRFIYTSFKLIITKCIGIGKYSNVIYDYRYEYLHLIAMKSQAQSSETNIEWDITYIYIVWFIEVVPCALIIFFDCRLELLQQLNINNKNNNNDDDVEWMLMKIAMLVSCGWCWVFLG